MEIVGVTVPAPKCEGTHTPILSVSYAYGDMTTPFVFSAPLNVFSNPPQWIHHLVLVSVGNYLCFLLSYATGSGGVLTY